MKTISKFKKYMDGWKQQDEIIFMLEYIRDRELEKLDVVLEDIMGKIDDPKENYLLVPIGLNALMVHNFLDSSVAYHRYMKAKRFLEKSKND